MWFGHTGVALLVSFVLRQALCKVCKLSHTFSEFFSVKCQKLWLSWTDTVWRGNKANSEDCCKIKMQTCFVKSEGKEKGACAWETWGSSSEVWRLDGAWAAGAGLHSFQGTEATEVQFSGDYGILVQLPRFPASARRMGMGCVCVFLPLVITAFLPHPFICCSLCSWKILFLRWSVCDLITRLSVREAIVQQGNGDLGGFTFPRHHGESTRSKEKQPLESVFVKK